MINNSTGDTPFDSSKIAVGNLSYQDLSKVLSVYSTALRGLGWVMTEEGPEGCLKTAANLLTQTLEAIHAHPGYHPDSSEALDMAHASGVAIGQALSAVMTETDPRALAQLVVAADQALEQAVEKIGDEFYTSHILFKAQPGENGIRLEVSMLKSGDTKQPKINPENN